MYVLFFFAALSRGTGEQALMLLGIFLKEGRIYSSIARPKVAY